MTGRSGARTGWFLLAVVGLTLAGCSDDGGGTGQPETTESSPFTIEPPANFELTYAGRGDQLPQWSDDTGGENHGGFTVLAPRDDPTETDQVTVVEATGFRGYQGGLHQASMLQGTGWEDLQVDGRSALVAEELDGSFTELMVVREGDDVALGLRSPELSVDELIELNGGTTLSPDLEELRVSAPDVSPPTGWSTVGEVQGDLRMGIDSYGDDPGPPSAHSAKWESASGAVLIALTLPSVAGDVPALLAWPRTTHHSNETIELIEVDGRPAAFITTSRAPKLVTTTSWGDLLVLNVSARGNDGDLVPTEDDLVAAAASVRRLTDAEWNDLAD
jgi:hypothetical protein